MIPEDVFYCDFDRSAPTAIMMQRKSLLNPYATPYVPLSKIVPGVSSERENRATLCDSENNEIIEKSADYQLPDSVSVDYDIQGLEKLEVSSAVLNYSTRY